MQRSRLASATNTKTAENVFENDRRTQMSKPKVVSVQRRRVTLDLPPLSMARLERAKKAMEATSYAEVVKRLLREFEAPSVESRK